MRIAPCIALSFVLALAACSEEPAPPPKAPAEPVLNISYSEMAPTKGYPLKTCVVTDKELATTGRPPYVIAYKAYEVQFCSKECLKEFAKDPEGYTRKAHPKALFDR